MKIVIEPLEGIPLIQAGNDLAAIVAASAQNQQATQTTISSSAAKTIRTEWKTPTQAKATTANTSDKAEDTNTAEEEESSTIVSMDAIYKGLADVKISETDEIVVDDTALKALNRALNRKDLVLSEGDLSLIKSIINDSLPAPAGEQAAEIVDNYYQYLQAHKEMTELNKQVGQPLDHEQHHQELNTLRELYLGQEVAEQRDNGV